MKLNILRNCILVILFFSLSSWGEKGHYKINSSTTEFFPKRISHLNIWTATLANHSSDADNRKKDDPNEAVRHFIDIDNYPDFVANHKIIENREAANQAYTSKFIMKNGTLPWVTDSTYNALVKNFIAKDWNSAVMTAANLGHYVGDGHMPLHITNNYDGKMTGQSGIHSRYESKMINQYVDQIVYKGSKARKIKDIKTYIFNYIYDNYKFKDSLLIADSQAYTAAGKEYSDVYYQNLWKSTKSLTIVLFASSSKSLAALIYTAWLEAGKPKIPKDLALVK
jgi:hypothetical protein